MSPLGSPCNPDIYAVHAALLDTSGASGVVCSGGRASHNKQQRGAGGGAELGLAWAGLRAGREGQEGPLQRCKQSGAGLVQ